LTPIFGPSFINECLRPHDPGFGRFKIDLEIVRRAALEAEGRKIEKISRSGSPEDVKINQDIPRSAPQLPTTTKQLRPRNDKPAFKLSSPFESDSDTTQGDRNYSYKSAALEPLELSPKSTHPEVTSSGWTSINCSRYNTPVPLTGTPVNALSKSLLTEPRYSPTVSWRAAEPEKVKKEVMSEAAQPRRRSTRSQKAVQSTETTEGQPYTSAANDSESDDTSISVPPLKKKKRLGNKTGINRPHDSTESARKGVSVKYNKVDYNAARWLLELHSRDAQLAKESNHLTGQKRKASPAQA
jgi:hypothetical protein